MGNQTAVEQLHQEFNETFYVAESSELAKRFDDIFKKAKQMEKEQHYNTWLTAQMNYPNEDYIGISKTFEHYYNETYGKE